MMEFGSESKLCFTRMDFSFWDSEVELSTYLGNQNELL